MALTDDLRAYIAEHGQPTTTITKKHNVAIVGETHAPIWNDVALIRLAASVRLLLELLHDPRYRYFGNEHFFNAGPVRLGVREYWRHANLPPPVDRKQMSPDILSDRATQEVAKGVITLRFQPVLDYLRAHPRFILSIGSMISTGPARDQRLAQHFFEETADRRVSPVIPGVLLLGAHHASSVPISGWATTRMLLEKRGFNCVSVRVLTDFVREDGNADDAVVPLNIGTPVTSISQVTSIRLTSLVDKTPWTVPTDRLLSAKQPSPFRSVAFSDNEQSVAEEFEYIVLQKA